jgi:hypothetical protein
MDGNQQRSDGNQQTNGLNREKAFQPNYNCIHGVE